jgi:alanine racemase
MPRPLIATIHLDAMRHNLARAKAVAPHSKVWAVVKAYAYGHGLDAAVRGFAAADGLALIELDGASRLRQLGWEKPILLLEGVFQADDLSQVLDQRLDIVVHNEVQIQWLEQLASLVPAKHYRPRIHLKMNSGMNRLGIAPPDYMAAYHRLRALPMVDEIVLMTHFANADQAHPPVLPWGQQVHRFQQAIQGLSNDLSLANSAATLAHPSCHAAWVRPGIMLYGASPGNGSAADWDLMPAMSLCSELISVQHIAAGEAVGYVSRFVAPQAMTIGVVACGYADGYPRHAPTGTPILVDGIRTRVIGRVSMDMITVDLTPVPQARIGTPVTLWGQGLPIDEVANAAGTIGYELMCALSARVQVQLLP